LVVVGYVQGIEDLLGDSVASISVDPRDQAQLAKAVINCLQQPETARHRAEALRAVALQRVDWKHIAAGYASVLQSILPTREIPTRP